MTIGKDIKRIRIEKGLTQKQLGDLCGMADSAIRRYELDKVNPKKETIEKIAIALGVDPFSLYSFDMATEALEKNISKKENGLLNRYRQLNDLGQEKAINYVEDLTNIPKYRRDPSAK